MLTHHSLEAQGAKAKQEKTEVSLQVMSERLNQIRAKIRTQQAKIRTQQAKVMLSKINNRNARSKFREFLKNELQIAA